MQNYVDLGDGQDPRDYLCGSETYRGHNGVDIRISDLAAQRRGVKVLAAAPGKVLRLRDGVEDISIRAPSAPSAVGKECGNGLILEHGDGWETQYCHMARGSLSVQPGQMVKRGQTLGRVGLSGMTEFPHLHMTVRRQGRVIDPFAPDLAPGQCHPIAKPGLWDQNAQEVLKYRAGAVLNAGFSGALVTADSVEDARLPPPAKESPFLVAYVRAVHLKAGDVQILTLTGPGGQVEAMSGSPPLDRDKAQTLSLVGLRRPQTGWRAGVYVGRYQLMRNGQEIVARRFEITL